MYAALRDADPVHHVEPGNYWVLSRFADVQAAVIDTGRYISCACRYAQGRTGSAS